MTKRLDYLQDFPSISKHFQSIFEVFQTIQSVSLMSTFPRYFTAFLLFVMFVSHYDKCGYVFAVPTESSKVILELSVCEAWR